MFNFTNTHTHTRRETSAHICCVLLLFPCLVSPSRSRTEWTRISLSIFKLLPTLRRALSSTRWLWRHSNSCCSTAAKRANGQHLSRHSNSTATSLCPCPCPHPCPWSSFPLSVGMLTMIMKPASGRAARVAKQQVGPHSALPCPGLPALFPSLPRLGHAATQIHRAPQHAAVFGPLRPSFSFSVLVSFSFSVFVPLRQDEGNFHHMRTYVLFVHSLLSLFRSRTLCLPLLCAVPLLLLRCLSCAWKFPFCKFPSHVMDDARCRLRES